MEETTPATSKKNISSSDKRLRKVAIAITLTIMATNISILGFGLTRTETGKFVLITVIILLFIALLLAFRGKLLLARIIIPVVVFLGMTYFLISGTGIHHPAIIGFPAIIILAGLFLGQTGIAVFGVLTTLVIAIVGYTELNGLFVVEYENLFNTLNVDSNIFWILNLTTAFIAFFLIKQLTQTTNEAKLNELAQIKTNEELTFLKNTLEEQVQKRTAQLEKNALQTKKHTAQLEAIADVASLVASLQDIDQLLPYITRTVSERFGFYHVGIFLLSKDNKFAVLRAANSEGGQTMLARKHQLRIGQEGVVGFTIKQKKAHIALDVGDDAIYFDNPDLPSTRSEMALPLLIGTEIIGVLDVQSKETNAFSNEDIDVLTTLANQVAVAIKNAHLFRQSQDALEELNITLQRYIRREWNRFGELNVVKGYRASKDGIEPIKETLKKDGKSEKTDFEYKVPVKLRDVVIGYLNVNLDKPVKQYSEDELDIIQATVDRFALAVENARLLEESQRRAERESMIGNISSKIGSSIRMDTIIQTTVKELGEALNGPEITFRLASSSSTKIQSSVE